MGKCNTPCNCCDDPRLRCQMYCLGIFGLFLLIIGNIVLCILSWQHYNTYSKATKDECVYSGYSYSFQCSGSRRVCTGGGNSRNCRTEYCTGTEARHFYISNTCPAGADGSPDMYYDSGIHFHSSTVYISFLWINITDIVIYRVLL